ncbi:MAG TPA: ABC transporter ATP-binding protein [Balneolales bacterium]|nr:ABC transporter ATP-binding protein [Balneolales bacterium]
MTSTGSKSDKQKNISNSDKAVDRALYRRLYQFIAPFRWWVGLALLLTVFAAFLGPLRPYLIGIALDKYVSSGDVPGLVRIIFYILAALLGESLMLVGNTYLTNWIGQGVLYSMRNAVFRKIQSLHVQYFDRNPLGRLITRTTNDIEAIDDLVSNGVVNMMGDLLRILFIVFFMLKMNWELTLVALSVMPLLIYFSFLFKKKVRVSFLNVRDQIARINSFIQEHINGMSIVQLFNRSQREADRFSKINAGHRNAYIQTIFYFALFWPAVELISTISIALVVWYGGAKALSGTVTFGVLVAFIQYVRQFFQPIRDLSEKYNTLQSAMAASERIFGVLETKNKIVEKQNPKSITRPQGHIVFRNVWFRYRPEDGDVLRDVSFEAKPGDTVAIVGATGAGKTTIINLLNRFYDIQKGEILMDGIDIRDLRVADLRSQMGLVMQDNTLFSGTVMDNITMGNPAIDPEKVVEAARLVEADSFIERLPGKFDFMLAERGASLSMGQRQLLCLMRALVYNSRVLILDEATSNVDSETEEKVSRAVDLLMSDRTSIVIAHRLSTIQHADQILVMHKGEIRERGTHQRLLKNKEGIYRKLYELQYKDQLLKLKSKKAVETEQ